MRGAVQAAPLRRRTVLRAGLLGATMLAPWPAGCGRDDDALTFFFAANPAEADARLRIIDAFHREHPDITVQAVLSGGDPIQQISTFCAGGKCPDVLMAWDFSYAGLADRGVLLDLHTLLSADRGFAAELADDSIAALYETFSFGGGQYALPEQWAGNFLFYNKNLFAEAGLDPPPSRWQQPWGYADFLDSAAALTRRGSGGRVSRWGFVDTWLPAYSAGLFAMNNGAPWSTPRINPTHFHFGDERFVEGVQFYADLANVHRVAPAAADTQAMSSTDLFAVGRAAMALGGHWRYQTFTRADDLDFDVTVLPTGPRVAERGGAARSNIGVTGLAIAAGSRRVQQAWEFVKFAAGRRGQQLIGESGLFVPVLTSAVRSAGFAAAHPSVRNLAVLTEGPAHSEGLPISPAWEKIAALMNRAFGPVLRGKRPAAVLDGLARQADAVAAHP